MNRDACKARWSNWDTIVHKCACTVTGWYRIIADMNRYAHAATGQQLFSRGASRQHKDTESK